MMDQVAHRGPDGEDYRFFGPEGTAQESPGAGGRWLAGLGHRRLAIVDLSPTGVQPMSNEDGSLWLVFNGEIYNHLELREELEGLGHVFTSRADSEVILHGFEAWGLETLTRFNGMFALALYDPGQRSLVLARDRLGIKPLYYLETGQGLFFASELKQFLVLPEPNPALEVTAVRDFLVHGALDHTARTFLTGVSQLEPASWLTADGSGRIARGSFHAWPEPPALGRVSPGQRARSAARLLDLLDDSVGLRLRADVPVGSCLSGGLDSSGVVCLAAERLKAGGQRGVRTGPGQHVFTAAYDHPAADERRFAGLVRDLTQTRHHLVFPMAQGLYADLERLVWHQDGPVETPSVYAQYKVMELVAQEGIKVTLDGQGADELLGGYAGHLNAYLAQLLRAGRAVELGGELIGLAGRTGLKGAALQALDVAAILLKREPRQAAWHAQWLDPGVTGPGDRGPLRCRDNLSRRLLEDATRLNLPRLLHYADRNSMAFGVEARVPYLDHRLADFALSLKPGLRIHRGWNKHLLRLALSGKVPPEVAWRKDKLGFAVPLKEWYLAGASFFRETLTPRPLIAPLFRVRDWASHVEEGLKTDRGLNWLWMLSNLETWCRLAGVSP